MESFLVRYRNPLLLVALVLAQVIMLASQIGRHVAVADRPDGKQVRLIRLWTETAASPFERVFHWVGSGVRYTWNNYFALRDARKENAQLKDELDRLRLEQASLGEDAQQARRLRAMLDFKQHYLGSLVAAQIIGTSGSDQSRVLYVDKGSKDGIAPMMPVITPDGIVGKVREVFPHTSQVLLINDQSSGAGVLLQDTRIRGVLRGNGYGQLEVINVMPDDRIKPGEKIIASGGDQVFPRGMPVGTVQSVQHDPAHDPYVQVLVTPAANLAKLEEVLIVTTENDAPPAQLAADVAAGEALAEQQKKAAEVLAEKLPTVKPEEVQANELANGPDRPHAPPQPLHPDRFTAGQTPPATELKPGVSPAGSAPLVEGPNAASNTPKIHAAAPSAAAAVTGPKPQALPKPPTPESTAGVTAATTIPAIQPAIRPRTDAPAAGRNPETTLPKQLTTATVQDSGNAEKPKSKPKEKEKEIDPRDFEPIGTPPAQPDAAPEKP